MTVINATFNGKQKPTHNKKKRGREREKHIFLAKCKPPVSEPTKMNMVQHERQALHFKLRFPVRFSERHNAFAVQV